MKIALSLLILICSAIGLNAADGYLAVSNGITVIGPGGSGGGSQTPWTSDINGATFQLTNVGTIQGSGSGSGLIILSNSAGTSANVILGPSNVFNTTVIMTNGSGLWKSPTNTPSDGQLLQATGVIGDTKWITPPSATNYISDTNGTGYGTVHLDKVVSTNYFGNGYGLTNLNSNPDSAFYFLNSETNFNDFIGGNAGQYVTNSYNVMIGLNAGQKATNVSSVIFIGHNAGNFAPWSSGGVFIGEAAGINASNATQAQFIGQGAGANATNAIYSEFIGAYAGEAAWNAQNSVFVGDNAGQYNTNANQSVHVGGHTGVSATNATDSVFLGWSSGKYAWSASGSVFAGSWAGYLGNAAQHSVFIGYTSGQESTNADHSVFVGDASGFQMASAAKSIFIGPNSGTNAANRLWIDTQSTTTDGAYRPLIYGEFDNRKLFINGSLTVTNGITAYGYNAVQTNSWTTNTAFSVGSTTNFVLVSGANTACGVTGIINGAAATSEAWGQLLVVASGNIVFTNPASIHASDFLTSRTITNGNNAMIAFDVWPGLATNMFITQTK